jgi:hypothetical protein
MGEREQALLEEIASTDREQQGTAYRELLELTSKRVDWAYQAWDQLFAALRSRDNRLRSIAAQLISNLAARSDPEVRILKELPDLLAVTHDEKFVTARHALQSLWIIGLAGDAQRSVIVKSFATRFDEAGSEKNGRLVRYDIIEALGKLFNKTRDEAIKRRSLQLIATEANEKHGKKYSAVWRDRLDAQR